MIELSRKEKKELRELSAKAYELELSSELKKLQSHFKDWNEGKISAFEMDDEIHHFYKGPHKALYVSYVLNSRSDSLVARALATGILSLDQISKSLSDKLERLISFYRTNHE